MQNRFLETDEYLTGAPEGKSQRGRRRCSMGAEGTTREYSSSQSTSWVHPLSAQTRVLVILIENGGVDLGVPTLVEKLLSVIPGGSLVPDSYQQKLVGYIRDKLKGFTDTLLETAELSINRYTAAKPDTFGDVVVLRDGTASYQALKDKLIALSRAGKIIDLFILTHGSDEFISVTGGINGQKIREMRTENGGPLSLRSVYMMNCVGSSLNQAWLDAGAKASSGSLRNNYLPEPTMFFFWQNWKAGQPFEQAATSAYRKTVKLMNDAVRELIGNLPVPGASSLAGSFDFGKLDFVAGSTPIVQGQRTVTVNSDDLTFSQSVSSSLATTVLPVELLRSWSVSQAASDSEKQARTISPEGVDFIKGWEGFQSNTYNDVAGHCTIGYGTLIHTGNCDGSASEQPYANGISEERALELLRQKVQGFQQIISDKVTVSVNQNQNDALVSLVYNIGSTNFQKSTLLKRLNEGKYEAVPAEFRKWTKIRQNGQLVDSQGLINRRNAEASLFAAPATATAQSIIADLSRPFYDTGEHAILAEFINDAISGPIAHVYPLLPTTTYVINTVRFTYGQIVTMGDFYDTFEDCKNASPAELNRLKSLIARSENHYKNSILGIGSPAADVPNSEWGDPSRGIGHRFIDLALRNNSHFAPPPTGTVSSAANNKQTWERYHSQAIQVARAGRDDSSFDVAYPVNAFGDHFLTDAFSAGHLINKELVMKKFVDNVITNGSVNAAGDNMFKYVAERAMAIPEVKAKLKRYELTETHLLIVHFNLDTNVPTKGLVFYQVLKGIMEDTKSGGRDQIANLAVKAAHDALNEYPGGVPVKNAKGDSWNLTGDGSLNRDNIMKVQLAVKQSVQNVEEAVRSPSTSPAAFYQRVWDYVPVLTHPATRTVVDRIVADYSNPSSNLLRAKAINLVAREIDTLIGALLDAGKIRLA